MRQRTINLRERAEEIREEKIPELEQKREDLIDECVEEFGDYENVPDSYLETYERMGNQIRDLAGEAKAIELDVGDHEESDCEPWSDTSFVVQEFQAATTANLQDEVAEASVEIDEQGASGSPKQGFARILTVQKAVIDYPEELPADAAGEPKIGELRHKTVTHLYNEIDELNSFGEDEMGNLSLREAMENRAD